MEQDVKVFSSEITRGVRGERNNLYELLYIEPAKPIRLNEVPKSHCTFQPKSDKHYEYKKKSKLKVKSVRDIRNSFENDISVYLPMSLEKQRNALMKRIRDGCSNDEDTKKLARNILKSDNPISRTAWQMLTNINPEGHAHPKQYIMFNGKNIRICGSKGGPDKYITNFEMRKDKDLKLKRVKKNMVYKKKCLIQNSLSIKIKPGPLTQKKYIDDSYQKYHVGSLELVSLPKPGLDVTPTYGSPMEFTIRNFVNSLRDVDGIISQKWAEFALSMLATVKNANIVQLNPNACTTFDLSYKYDQKKMLMRRDIENVTNYSKNIQNVNKTPNDKQESIQQSSVNEDDVMEEVTKVIFEIIDSVEISLNQDNVYTGEDEERPITGNMNSISSNNNCKKKFGELDRLHVTVIRLPENAENTDCKSKICNNSFCILGCICESLNSVVIVKGHCGRLECMFQCKCDFSRCKELDNYDNVCPDLMPGLLKLDKEMNLKLAKEEQKFHQTVVLSGEKSILLKPNRRSWKASTKYSDFYKTMNLKTKNIIERELVVIDTKINCNNIEPWCMVHNLYKCFCKGRFVHNVGETEIKHFEASVNAAIECDKIVNSESSINTNQTYEQTRMQREQTVTLELRRKERWKSDKSNKISESSVIIDLDDSTTYEQRRKRCARVEPYGGRNYSRRYYSYMNQKISEMEKDDETLVKKLKYLTNIEETESDKISNDIVGDSNASITIKECYGKKNFKSRYIDNGNPIPNKKCKNDVSTEEVHRKNNNVSTNSEEIELNTREQTPELSADHIRENILSGGFATTGLEGTNKGKLVAWLEYSYKQYKLRCESGITKLTLQAPQPKKMALLPWNFILERYKERKNLFLVTKQKPFRMYMAVNRDHPFLQDCLNIDDIRFADLYKYPITVKKLLTNASDLKDSFCILCGHAYCWELIGSVTKIDESNNKNNLQCDELETNEKSLEYNDNSCSDSESISPKEDEETNAMEAEMRAKENVSQSDSSKWFVMTIENDFSEIQFFKRGFFVKYDSIIKAINIARYSHKTVRLSSQKCAEASFNSQFGIYAIPNANEDCVFIGPYECNEPLGIETVKSITFTKQLKRTRGYWITTNKIDNIKVIESPMSFMPDKNIQPNEILSLKSNPNDKKDSFSSIEHINEDTDKSQRTNSTKNTVKLSKPIKVFKHNSFYCLSSNSLLKLPINMQQENNLSQEKGATVSNVSLTDLLSKLSTRAANNENNSPLTKPEIDSDSKKDDSVRIPDLKSGEVNTEGSTFAILKPEEINKRIMDTNFFSKTDDFSNDSEGTPFENPNNPDPEIEKDISKFLSNVAGETSQSPVEDRFQNMDVLVISDEEEERLNNSPDAVYNVWIESKSIENFGWIPGKRNSLIENGLSFQFPGFNFSEFYPINIAFNKLTQVLSRKICIPASMKLEWRIVSSKDELTTSKKLQATDLGSDLILTRKGPRRKLDILKDLSFVKTYSRKPKAEETADHEIEELE